MEDLSLVSILVSAISSTVAIIIAIILNWWQNKKTNERLEKSLNQEINNGAKPFLNANFDALFKKYIYLIKNKVNGMVYIGKTTNIEVRWKRHKSKANYINKLRNCRKNVHTEYFINALIKHGFEVWKINKIDVAFTQEELDEKEIYWIAYFRQTLGRDKVYNILDGGTGGRCSDEILQKLGRIMSTRWEDQNWKKKRSEDQRRIMTKRWENGDMKKEDQSKSMELRWKNKIFKNNQCRLMREKWAETKKANKKNGIYLRNPIKNEEEFKIDVKKLTLEQLTKKYNKSLNTIRKNIIYYLGINFRKKRIRT